MGGVGVHSHSCPSRGRLAATGYRREADQMFRMLYEIALAEAEVLRCCAGPCGGPEMWRRGPPNG
jgi:hypothetical protein